MFIVTEYAALTNAFIVSVLLVLSHVYMEILYVFLSLKMGISLVNSTDPDEMQRKAAFHVGLHCLPKYPFRGFPKNKELKQ